MGGLILLVFAAVFLGLGPFLIKVGWGSRRYAHDLTLFSTIALRSLQMGQRGYLEGILSQRNEVAKFDLVAYRLYRYGGERKKRSLSATSVSGEVVQREPIWSEQEAYRPVLFLDVGGETVRVTGQYHLVYESARLVDGETLTKGQTLRYDGFRRGDRVTVVGEVAADSEGKLILASNLTGQSFTEYRENYQSSGGAAIIAGMAMLILALILITVSITSFT